MARLISINRLIGLRRAGNGLDESSSFASSPSGVFGRCHAGHGLPGGRQKMIDVIIVAKIFSTYMGLWAMGFGIGKSVAWTKAIVSVS